jgi:ABC-type Zn uptake system ZnuABC Zn-binding protein ZnuA
MHRIYAFLILVCCFWADFTSAEKPRVLATINIIADMAAHVAGPHLEIRSLLPDGTDPHTSPPGFIPHELTQISKQNHTSYIPFITQHS